MAKVKNSFKTLGGNFTEETIDRKSKATALVNSILENDSQSLLLDSGTSGHSWERFDGEEIERFKLYVKKLKPFMPSQRKEVKYSDSSIPKSLYSCLNSGLIEKFFNMKLRNML